MIALIVVNTAFAAGLAAMLIFKVTSNAFWLAFLASWFSAEAILARDQSIKWWHWALLLMILCLLDLIILMIFMN